MNATHTMIIYTYAQQQCTYIDFPVQRLAAWELCVENKHVLGDRLCGVLVQISNWLKVNSCMLT